MCCFIAHHHQQQDRTRSNQRLCTLCVFNMCLFFGDYQTQFGRGGCEAQSRGIWRDKERGKKSCQAGGGGKKKSLKEMICLS